MTDRSSRTWILTLAVCMLIAAMPAWAINPARIKGKVEDDAGRPLAGVKVTFTSTQAGRPPRTVTTKKNGGFTVPFIEYGNYLLSIEAEGRGIQAFFLEEKGAQPRLKEPLQGELGPDQEFPDLVLQPSHNYTLNLVLRSIEATEALRSELERAGQAQSLGEAEQMFRTGDLEGALASLDASLATDPENGLGHYLRGMTLMRLERLDDALEALRRAVEIVPDQPGVHFGIGTVLLEQADGLEELAQDSAALARRKEAVVELERERELSPSSTEVLTNLALAYQKSQDHEKAAMAFEELIEARPDDLSAYFALADCYSSLGRPEDAVATLDGIPLTGGDVAVGFYNVAVSLFNERKPEQAVYALEKAVGQDEGHAKSWRLLGMARLQTGESEGALEAFRRFLELAPEDPEVGQVEGLVEYLESQAEGS